MSNLHLTDEERLIVAEIPPRAADLKNIIEAYQNASIRLEVLAAFLRSGRGQPNMLYALALTDQVYETLTGQHLPLPDSET